MKPPLWIIALIRKAFPTRFFLSRMTRKFGFFSRFIEHALFRDDHITFLPNPRTITLNTALDSPGQAVVPTAAISHFIDKAESFFIMDTCICRHADSCESHSIDLGCLFMGEATHNINKKLGKIVSKSDAYLHIERAEKEGLIFLIARNHLDTLWTGAKPGGKLLTVCFCCQCCCLWKALPYISDDIAAKVHSLPGVTVKVLKEACIGCGSCTEGACFADAISVQNGKAVIADACRGCGRCVAVCPQNAISLTVPGDGEVKRLVQHLETLVDVEQGAD